MAMNLKDLDHHIAEVEERIRHQRQLIADLEKKGADASHEQQQLDEMVTLLAELHRHRQEILSDGQKGS